MSKDTPTIPVSKNDPTLRPDEVRLRAMPMDEYVIYMLESGRYRVDIETGAVSSARNKRPLRPQRRRRYVAVNLAYSSYVNRRASVHRIVAVAVWGVEAIRGKEVHHINGNKTENGIANLGIAANGKEHAAIDAPRRTACHASVKTSWEPCAACGDPDGFAATDRKTPDRFAGERFGIDGQLCKRCYARLNARYRYQNDPDYAAKVKASALARYHHRKEESRDPSPE